MREYLKKLPREIKYLIALARKVSKETKMPAYLVGGFPRDLILGVKDWDLDITVEGDGINFAERLAKRLNSRIIRHERFGTATLILDDQLKVDIATTRKETYPSSASLPVVSPGSLKEDLLRRDFTINAMAVNIAGGVNQKLIDFFGGKEDLMAGKICVLHNLSFRDDPTRILRAIRFEQRYNFKIEPETFGLLKEAINLGLLNKVNPHRMRDDLILMLKEKNPLKQIKRLSSLGALSFINNKLNPGKPTYDLFKSIDKEIFWFLKNFPACRKLDTWLIYFAALLKPLTFAQIKEITQRFGLSKAEEERIVSYRKISQAFIKRLSNKQIKPMQVFTLLKPLSYEAIILLRTTSRNSSLQKHISDFLEIYNGMRLHISGDDLYGLGVLPGPGYQKIFAKVLAAKLNGKVKSRQEELALIRKLVKIK